MLRVLFKLHTLDAVYPAQHLGKLFRLRECHVGHHDLGVSVCNELAVHDLQALTCLRGVRQIIGQLIVDVRLARREDRQHARHGKQHHEQPALIHDERRHAFHKRFLHTPAPHQTASPRPESLCASNQNRLHKRLKKSNKIIFCILFGHTCAKLT